MQAAQKLVLQSGVSVVVFTAMQAAQKTHAGYSKDLEKYNSAQILGFSRLAFTTEQISKGQAIETIELFIQTADLRKEKLA